MHIGPSKMQKESPESPIGLFESRYHYSFSLSPLDLCFGDLGSGDWRLGGFLVVSSFKFLNVPFLANFYKHTGISGTTNFDKLAKLQLIFLLFFATYF